MEIPDPLVSVDWLRAHIDDPGVAVIDASWRLGEGAGPARRAFEDAHIPGAVFFDIDEISDPASSLPHMAPPPEIFEEKVGALGIRENDAVIVYDQDGVASSPRVWWTFRAMGHRKVAVLNGGLPAWRRNGGRTASGPATKSATRYAAQPDPALVADAEAIRRRGADTAVLDARPRDRFEGIAPEPRPGLRAGAMPGAISVPAASLLTAAGELKGRGDLERIFDAASREEKTAILTCGSGVAAALLGLGLTVIGRDDWRLYDGSWAEWGLEENDIQAFPVVIASGSGR